MAKVFIKYLPPYFPNQNLVQELAEFQVRHTITDDPASADIILFTKLASQGPFLNLLFDPLYRQFRSKCFLFCSGDNPLYFLPGLFPSVGKSAHDPKWALPFHYIHGPSNSFFDVSRLSEKKKYLYSFIGNLTNHWVRQKIASLTSTQALIVDTRERAREVKQLNQSDRAKYHEQYRREYANSLYQSQFVLCPRGYGPSSFRIFETMRCGRVPVIISDDWVAPTGPQWEHFSVQVPESKTACIPEKLVDIRHRSQEMGLLARKQWEKWFSPQVTFSHMIDNLLNMSPHKNRLSIHSREFLRGFSPNNLKGSVKQFILRKPRW